MRSTLLLCALVVVVLATSGCTPGDSRPEMPPVPPGLPRPVADSLRTALSDEVGSWKSPSKAHADETHRYLRGKGQLATRLSARTRRAESDLDKASLRDRCRELSTDWNQHFPPEKLLVVLRHIPDAELGGAVSEQFDAIIGMLDSCRRGHAEKAWTFARVARAWSDVFGVRRDQLERAR